MTGEVTKAIAEFAAGTSFRDIPEAVIARGRIHILDSIGLALAGAKSEASRIVREHFQGQGLLSPDAGRGRVSVIGTGLFAPMRHAAFANGAAIHADNFDDTSPQARPDRTGGIHASGAVLPAALAVAEAGGLSGERLLAAYHVGMEVSSRLNHAMDARHYGDGFHTTGTLNVFGAAAAAGHAFGLDETSHIAAVGLAASQSSGVRRNFGTMAEILHSGHAAECGIAAADFARLGMTAADDALDGPVGYFAAAGGGYDAGEIVGKLGAPFVFEEPGVWIKPHPNGALTHPGAACLLRLLREASVEADAIRSIRVMTNPRVLRTLIHHDPQDAMQGKFSMEFTLAIVALERRAGLADFTDETLARSDIRSMMGRIAYSAYEETGPDFTNVTTLVEVELADGRKLFGRADYAAGSTRDPMSWDDVADKFRQCASYGGHPAEATERIVELVSGLDRQEDVGELVAFLRT